MSDVWELSAYVEAHPDNLDQRWRLAKKLYTAFEYRLALEHLLVLKNDWGPRANVTRYLAATYFRLGRYDEAIREMSTALERYPDDLGLHEQLARTLVVADRKEEAIKQWQQVLKLRPDHSFAERAIVHLQEAVDREAEQQNQIEQAKAGSGLEGPAKASNEVACPSCGEKNSTDFKRCWKCHAQLFDVSSGPSAFVESAGPAPARVRYPLLTGILMAGLLALGVFLTLRGFTLAPARADGAPAETVLGLLNSAVLWTRVGVGVALLLGLPLAWRLAARFSGAEDRIYNDTLYQYGALMALVTYALLWTPWRWLTAAAVAPAVLSALIAFMALRIKPREAARLWLFQLAAAAVLALGVIVARHGPGLITGAPAIAAYVARANEPSVFTSTLSAPGEIRVVWTTSGSAWLDRNGSQVQLTLAPANTSQRIFLETMEEGTAVSFEQVLGETFTSGLPEVRPGREYVFRVRTNSPVGVNFTLRGLLRASVELKPIEVPPGT